jgi:hypothetical protein
MVLLAVLKMNRPLIGGQKQLFGLTGTRTLTQQLLLIKQEIDLQLFFTRASSSN